MPQDHARVWPAVERGAISGLGDLEVIDLGDVRQNVTAVCVAQIERNWKCVLVFMLRGAEWVTGPTLSSYIL